MRLNKNSILTKMIMIFGIQLLVFIIIIILLDQNAQKSTIDEFILTNQLTFSQFVSELESKIDTACNLKDAVVKNIDLINFLDNPERSNESEFLNYYLNNAVSVVKYASAFSNNKDYDIKVYYVNDNIPESHPYFYHIRRYQQNEAVQSFIEDDSAAVMWLAAEKKPEWFSGQYKNSVNYTLFGKIYSTSRNMLGLAAVMVDQQYLLPSIPGGNEEDQTLQLLDRQEMTAEIGVDFMEDYDTLEASGLPAGHLIKADHLYFYHYLPEIQKLLVYRVSLNDLKNSMQRSIIYNLLIMMICFAIFIVAFIYFFRLIFIRLRRMISIMHKVIQGDVKIRIPDDRPDELGQLARDMNGLIDMNNELIEKMLMKERLRKEAQISALQYQINPHFIYNTLDAFQMRLIKEKMYWIADLLADFGKILRYNLSDKTQETTLGEELNLIRKYLNLQKISTSQEIELELSIDESLKKYPVIKFLLQPVVENSIKYGRNNNRLLKIEITTAVKQHDIYIAVKDNGPGIPGDKLRELNETFKLPMLQYREHSSAMKGAIGLQNINSRLRLFYGEQYYLIIESELNQGTSVIIRIPYKWEVGSDVPHPDSR